MNYSEGLLQFTDALYEVMRISPLLPIVGLFLFRHKVDVRFARGAILAVTSLDLLMEYLSPWLWSTFDFVENGMPSMHVYEMVIGVVLFAIFSWLLKGFIASWIIWGVSAITLSLGIYAWIVEGPYALYSWPYSIVQIFVLLFSLLYFIKVFFDSKVTDLAQHLPFWLVSAIFVYNGTLTFVTLFESVIRSEMSDLWLYSHMIILITSILYNIIYFAGIVRTGKFRFSAKKQPLTD